MAYVKFELNDGTFVFIEASDQPRGASGLLPPSKGDHPSTLEVVSFDDSISAVRKMAEAMVEQMREKFQGPPDEVQINFGLKASAEVGGIIVSRGGMESNFNVMLRWGNRNKKNDPTDEEEEEEKPVKEKEKPAKKTKEAVEDVEKAAAKMKR
jgi:hypothetical protein